MQNASLVKPRRGRDAGRGDLLLVAFRLPHLVQQQTDDADLGGAEDSTQRMSPSSISFGMATVKRPVLRKKPTTQLSGFASSAIAIYGGRRRRA